MFCQFLLYREVDSFFQSKLCSTLEKKKMSFCTDLIKEEDYSENWEFKSFFQSKFCSTLEKKKKIFVYCFN